MPPTGRCDRSIGPMLSSPRNPPSNRLLPSASSRFTHQVKLTSSLSKTRLRKAMSRPPSMANTSRAAQARTGGAARPHPPSVWRLTAPQDELVLREPGVEVRQGHAVERQVPGGEPGILPLVRHRHDVEGVEVAPPGIAAAPAGGRRRGLGRVSVEPAGHVVVVELL